MAMALSLSTAHAFEWTEVNFGLGVYQYDNIRPDNKFNFLDMDYMQKDPIYEPIPTFRIRVGPFFVNKDGAGVVLLYFKELKLLGLALYEGERYKAEGMAERKRSFHFGAGLRLFNLEALFYQDVQHRSEGKVLKIFYAPIFEFNNYSFTPRAYFQYWDKRYVDYFFGVEPEEVDLDIGRTQYTGKRTINYGFMLQNIWTAGRMQYVLSAGYKFYGPRVSNSPTVDRNKERRIILGFMYKFY